MKLKEELKMYKRAYRDLVGSFEINRVRLQEYKEKAGELQSDEACKFAKWIIWNRWVFAHNKGKWFLENDSGNISFLTNQELWQQYQIDKKNSND